jgi:hypothetical protein
MINAIDDAQLEERLGRLEAEDNDHLSSLMRLVGLDPLTDLRHADAQGANFNDQDFTEADLEGADLRGARMLGTILRRANLKEARLSNAHLAFADLSQADLSYADLSNADLTNANLSGAIMTATRLEGANLLGTELIKAGERAESRQPEHASQLQVRSMTGQAIQAMPRQPQFAVEPADTGEYVAYEVMVNAPTWGQAAARASANRPAPPRSWDYGVAVERTGMGMRQALADADADADADAEHAPGAAYAPAFADGSKFIQAHPITTLAMAAGVGFLLATLLKGRD